MPIADLATGDGEGADAGDRSKDGFTADKENVEPVTGIEPASQPWEGRVLPMNYTGVWCRLEGYQGVQMSIRTPCSRVRASGAATGLENR